MTPSFSQPQTNLAFVAATATEYHRCDKQPGRAYGITGGVSHTYQDSTPGKKLAINLCINAMSEVKPHLAAMANANGVPVDEQFTYCFLGVSDHVADIHNGKVFFDKKIGCPLLGECKHAQQVCLKMRGLCSSLTNGELRTVTGLPMPSKIIAAKIHRSVETVREQEQSARRKLRHELPYNNREGLTQYLTNHGII